MDGHCISIQIKPRSGRKTYHKAQYARLGTLNTMGGMLESNLETVSYMKLKQLTLGYNLPKRMG